MKNISFFVLLSTLLMITSCKTNAQSKSNTDQKKEGWTMLFDGTSTNKWRGYNKDSFPTKGWKIKNENLVLLPGEGGGTIITKKKYCNFILKLEWKISKGGNSGIFYRALEQPREAIYWSAPEMQVLDNANNPDSNKGTNGNHKAGSLYDLIPAQPQNAKPYGEWNSVKIVAKGAHIEQWQNGQQVVEFNLWTPDWYAMLRNSKFVSHPAFGDMRCGHIGLQDHGYKVSFRNIKIKVLDETK